MFIAFTKGSDFAKELKWMLEIACAVPKVKSNIEVAVGGNPQL